MSSTATPTAAKASSRRSQTRKKVSLRDIFDDYPVDEDDVDEEDEDDEENEEGGGGDTAVRGKKKRTSSSANGATDAEERRERNREHSKRSRVRKKFLLDSLQKNVQSLQEENERLRFSIQQHLPNECNELLAACSNPASGLLAPMTSSSSHTNTRKQSQVVKIFEDPDYSLVKSLQLAQQNFVITDPSLPDNPITYASQGFLSLTRYPLEQVLGRNCRFIQGQDTDMAAVAKLRQGIAKGEDTVVCLLNYRSDNTTFWNQVFISPLRDASGKITNYLGVQCKVTEDYARNFMKLNGPK